MERQELEFEMYKEGRRLGIQVSEWTHEKITRLKITCCSGAENACWYRYVKRIDSLLSLPDNSIVRLIQYDGKPILINTSYIVEAEDFTLVTAKLEEQQPNKVKHFLVDDGKEMELINDVTAEDNALVDIVP